MSAIVDPTVTDRLLNAFRKLLRAEDPNRTYRGISEYLVGNVTSTSADATPTDTSLSLPAILRIPLRSGLVGETAKLTVGKTCLVSFINGDPTRPFIFSADVPQTATMDATQQITVGSVSPGTLPNTTPHVAARVGDAVGPFLITTGSTKVLVGG